MKINFQLFLICTMIVFQCKNISAAIVRAKDRSGKKYTSQARISLIESDSYVNNQARLMQDLFTYYDNRIRPVKRPLQPVNITVRMNLYQIVEVEERTQHVAVYAWMTQMWYDELLAWDPSEYGNVTTLILPYTQIWIPDTYLYNNLQMEREASERWSHVIIETVPGEKRASITFRYPAMYKFICLMNLRLFPFDRQHCKMQFGSWTYDTSGVDYYPEQRNVAKEDYVESGNEEWKLLSFISERRVQKYACCQYPFTLLEFHLIVERRPSHYIVDLVIPTFIVAVVSNVGFFTPTTTGGERIEKVNLGLTTLLAYSVLLMMVSESMPSTASTVPLIGWFLLGTMVQTSIATIITTIILLIHKRGNDGQPVPPILKRFFFGWLNQYLRVRAPDSVSDDCDQFSTYETPVLTRYIRRRPSTNVYGKIYFGHNGQVSSRKPSRVVLDEIPEMNESACDMIKLLPLLTVTPPDEARRPSSISGMCRINDAGMSISRHTDNEEYNDKDLYNMEWEWLASILDRFCLILSIISLILYMFIFLAIGYLGR